MIKELHLHEAQQIASQLDTLYQEIGLDQSPGQKLRMLKGEVDEVEEAWEKGDRDGLPGELADVLFCTLSMMNDLGIDANMAMEYVFTKNFGRVNREHIENTRNGNGLHGRELYNRAKESYDAREEK